VKNDTLEVKYNFLTVDQARIDQFRKRVGKKEVGWNE